MSQRHKRENFFFFRSHAASVTPGDVIGPVAPLDSADEKGMAVLATDRAYNEMPAWPNSGREKVVV